MPTTPYPPCRPVYYKIFDPLPLLLFSPFADILTYYYPFVIYLYFFSLFLSQFYDFLVFLYIFYVQMALAGVLLFANINYKKIHQSVHKICLALF
jgi:hypothetical protein